MAGHDPAGILPCGQDQNLIGRRGNSVGVRPQPQSSEYRFQIRQRFSQRKTSRMIFVLFTIGVTAAFFVSSMILLNYGRHLGLRYLRHQGADSMAGLATVEGAVFALIGLLLAFTISGALQRFDERRQLVVQEANATSTAYDRLGLFEEEVARNLQTKLKNYVHARIELYRMPHDFLPWQGEVWPREQQDKILELKTNMWDTTVAACPQASFRPACSLALPALSSAFEVARLRAGAAEKHPPQIVYIMLFGLGLGGSLLAGFGMAGAKARSWIHMGIFAAALTFTLYVVTDMEFPRLGLIQVESFDHFLVDVHEQMR
jgi:hypothetical protein